jgi:hypothetical protein
MPQRPWKTARNPLKVRKYPVATLLLQLVQGSGEEIFVIHDDPAQKEFCRI